MFPTGRRCARPDLPHAARRLARRASAIARCVAAWSSLAVAGLAGAQQNLGFETLDAGAPAGWSVAGGADEGMDARGRATHGAVAEVSDTTAFEGERSLEVTRIEPGVTRVTQRVPADVLRLRGDRPRAARVKLTGFVRAPAPGVSASLWLRIDGPLGPLFLDSGGHAREGSAESVAAVAEASAAPDWRRLEVELPLSHDVDDVAFGAIVRGQGSAWFDALELTAVVTDAAPPPAPGAARYLDAAIEVMREHSLRRAKVDWATLREEALEHARGATTLADAHLAVRFALRELGDGHSYLQSAAATRALASTAVANARTGAPLTAPEARRLGESLGYVSVPSFAGGTPAQQVEFAEKLKNEIQTADDALLCGWIVDLRQNTGGNLWPMLAGLGPLLGEGELAASVYPDGRRVPVWHRGGQAGFGDYTQLRVRSPYSVDAGVPAAVLLGPATASSAEILAVALRSRAATRFFGAPTRGLSAGNRIFSLADGASLVLTVAATSDTEGRVYAGPIVPDEVVDTAGTRRQSGTTPDATLAAAVSWLTAGDGCR
jgi:hypothetical protein